MHGAHPHQQLSVVCAGAAEDLAGRALDLRVRARARVAPARRSRTTSRRSTPERVYLQSLLLALANPYGFLPGQLATVLRYLQEYCHWAKLTDVAPVHRMAKAVAIVPVGHDFPPFSANKGGSIDGSKIFLLTFDLAFQIQEQLRALEAGGDVPAGIGRDPRRGCNTWRC